MIQDGETQKKQELIKVQVDYSENKEGKISFILVRIKQHDLNTLIFLYNNSFYKNHKAQKCQKNKNYLGIMLRLTRTSGTKNSSHKGFFLFRVCARQMCMIIVF